MDSLSKIDLIELGKRHRLQTVVFKMALDVFDQMQPTWKGNRDSLLSQVIGLVQQVLDSDRIRSSSKAYDSDPLKRRVLLILNMNRIVQHIWEAMALVRATRPHARTRRAKGLARPLSANQVSQADSNPEQPSQFAGLDQTARSVRFGRQCLSRWSNR